MRLLGRRTDPPVVVLGSGPAGLFAAHAAVRAGRPPRIFSRSLYPSDMFGAQYLHAPIPGLPAVSAVIDYQLTGTVMDYARKVYGSHASGLQVSPSMLGGVREVWDIRTAYLRAWELYGERVEEVNVTPEWMLSEMAKGGALHGCTVVSSIPLPAICLQGQHHFRKQLIWASGDAPALDRWCPIACPPNTVICNGLKEPAWYRVSNIFGHTTAEWPDGLKPPVPCSQVVKPLSTNCDCFRSVRRVGRYGTWAKGVLAHQSYDYVTDLLS